jgi:hypothetical protein
MRIDRPARAASFLLTIAVGVAFTIAGCGPGGDGKTAEVSPEALQKTQDMLNNMHKNMQEKHRAQGKTKTAGKGP